MRKSIYYNESLTVPKNKTAQLETGRERVIQIID